MSAPARRHLRDACCGITAAGRLFYERIMPNLIQTFTARGDLAHLALFLWATQLR
jgi:hypothetical protein